MAEIALKGGRELQEYLRALPVKLEKNVVRGALRAAAKVVAIEAQQLVPVKTGLTKASIKITTGTRGGLITAKVKTKGKNAWKAKFIEFGTAAHWITVEGFAQVSGKQRKRGRVVSVATLNRAARMTANGSADTHSLIINGKFVGQAVSHPGAKPHPFMRPALDRKAEEAVSAAAAYIRARLTKEGLSAPEFGIDSEDSE